MAKKVVKNFRGVHAVKLEKMTREQLIAHLQHEYGLAIGEGQNDIKPNATRDELFKRAEEEDVMAWNDYRDKLIDESRDKSGDLPASH